MKPDNTTGQTLDISRIVLPMKPVILREFDKLKEGESMVIANEHNPYILYYQLLEDRGNIFKWEYLEEGPQKWRVKITKQMEEIPELTIGEMAALDYSRAEIFQRFGLTYCCSGEKTLKEACEEAGVSEEAVEQVLIETAKHKAQEVYAFERWEPDFLSDYIINTHHSYLKDNMGMIYGMSLNAAEQEGEQHPEIKELSEYLKYFFSVLYDHMQKEEQEFFPLLRKMVATRKKKGRTVSLSESPAGTAIRKMALEHKEIGESLKFIKKLTRNYTLPVDSCSSCTYLFAKLMEFESDLVQHIHLENNILFPKVAALEKDLQNNRP